MSIERDPIQIQTPGGRVLNFYLDHEGDPSVAGTVDVLCELLPKDIAAYVCMPYLTPSTGKSKAEVTENLQQLWDSHLTHVADSSICNIEGRACPLGLLAYERERCPPELLSDNLCHSCLPCSALRHQNVRLELISTEWGKYPSCPKCKLHDLHCRNCVAEFEPSGDKLGKYYCNNCVGVVDDDKLRARLKWELVNNCNRYCWLPKRLSGRAYPAWK
jgi:hypothetical protein